MLCDEKKTRKNNNQSRSLYSDRRTVPTNAFKIGEEPHHSCLSNSFTVEVGGVFLVHLRGSADGSPNTKSAPDVEEHEAQAGTIPTTTAVHVFCVRPCVHSNISTPSASFPATRTHRIAFTPEFEESFSPPEATAAAVRGRGGKSAS